MQVDCQLQGGKKKEKEKKDTKSLSCSDNTAINVENKILKSTYNPFIILTTWKYRRYIDTTPKIQPTSSTKLKY